VKRGRNPAPGSTKSHEKFMTVSLSLSHITTFKITIFISKSLVVTIPYDLPE
jgi:hypothetical protein